MFGVGVVAALSEIAGRQQYLADSDPVTAEFRRGGQQESLPNACRRRWVGRCLGRPEPHGHDAGGDRTTGDEHHLLSLRDPGGEHLHQVVDPLVVEGTVGDR